MIAGTLERLDRKAALSVAVVLTVGLAVTLVLFSFVRGWEQERLQTRFEATAKAYEALFDSRIRLYLAEIEGLRRFYDSSKAVDREEFHVFARPVVSEHPEIQAFGWVPRVTRPDRQSHEDAARRDGLGGYEISEKSAQGARVRAAGRDTYYPVYFVEPMEGNEPALGYDLGSEPARLAALEQARDTGRRVATSRIMLVQEAGHQFGILVFEPVYRNGVSIRTVAERRKYLRGFVLEAFRIKDVFETAISELRAGGIDIHLLDESAPPDERLLYFHPSRMRRSPSGVVPERAGAVGHFQPHYVGGVDVAGRHWSLIFSPVPEYMATHRQWQSGILLTVGLLLTAWLAAYLIGSRRRTAFIEAVVDERTAQLKDSEVRQRTLLDTIVEGIISIDAQGFIETFNPAAERLFGYSADEVLGKNVSMLMPEPHRSAHDGYLKRYLVSGEAHVIGIGRELEGRRKDGTTFPMDLAVSEMHLGGRRLFSGVVRDITERKRVERMKDEFISTVSHELRTPLTAIRGSLGLLTGGAMGELPGEVVSLLALAQGNTERLLQLINDILDINRIDSGQMQFHFETVAARPFLERALGRYAAHGAQQAVRFAISECVEDGLVFADRERLLQVMGKLMSNAAKFSPEGGTVDIAAARRGDAIRVSVTDHGMGIPGAFRDKVFDRFTQADSSDNRKAGGTGLGLSISKAIVEKHGGRIGFFTGEGAGTTFYFDLPESRRQTGDERSTASSVTDG